MEKCESSLYTPPSTSDVDSSEERCITPETITSNELPSYESSSFPPGQLPGDKRSIERKPKEKLSALFGKKNPIVKTPSPALARSRARKPCRPYDYAQSPVRKYIRESPSRRCRAQSMSSSEAWPVPRKRQPGDFPLDNSLHEHYLIDKPPPGPSRRATSGMAAAQPMREISVEALEAARKAIFSEIYSDFEDSSEGETDVDLLINLSTAYSVKITRRDDQIPDLICHSARGDISEMTTAVKGFVTQGSENTADGPGNTFAPDEQYQEAESMQPPEASDRTERSKSSPPYDVQIEEKSIPRRSLKRKRGASYSLSEERNSKYPVRHPQSNAEAQVFLLSGARHLNVNVVEPPRKRIYHRTKVEETEAPGRARLGFFGWHLYCMKILGKYLPSREVVRKAAAKSFTVFKDFIAAMIFWWVLTFIFIIPSLTDEYQYDRDGKPLTLMEQFEKIRYLIQGNMSIPALLSFWVLMGRVLKKNYCWFLYCPWLYHSGHILFSNTHCLIRNLKDAGRSVGMIQLLFFLLLVTSSFYIVIRCLDDISRERRVFRK